MIIRPATADDAAALSAFAYEIFVVTFLPDNDPEDVALYVAATYSTERQHEELATPGTRVFLAVENDVIAGYVYVRDSVSPECVPYEPALEIARFYVGTPWQGRGVASALMDAALGEAKLRGVTGVWLGVWERNPRAMRFYERSGFRDVGSHPFQFGRALQVDRVMARPLTGEGLRAR